MKKLFVMITVIGSALVIGCQKDEGQAEAVACGPGHFVTPAYGSLCLPQAQCQPGYVQNPTQPSMCMHMYTGASGGTQQCGAGFVLTSKGCLPQCPNQPNRGLFAETCIDAIHGGGFQQQMPYGYGGYQQPQMPMMPNYGYGLPYFRYY